MLNKITLIGHVGKEPEIKQVNDTKLATFSLATKETWKNKEGKKQEATEWHNIEVWGPLANVVENWVNKGDLLFISGKIKTDKYEKDGQDRYITKVVGRELIMLGSKGDNSPKKEVPKEKKDDSHEDVEDLPF